MVRPLSLPRPNVLPCSIKRRLHEWHLWFQLWDLGMFCLKSILRKSLPLGNLVFFQISFISVWLSFKSNRYLFTKANKTGTCIVQKRKKFPLIPPHQKSFEQVYFSKLATLCFTYWSFKLCWSLITVIKCVLGVSFFSKFFSPVFLNVYTLYKLKMTSWLSLCVCVIL